MQYSRQLTGWRAALVGLGIIAIVAYQCARRIRTVDDTARFAIGVALTREYQGTGLRRQVREYMMRKASDNVPTEPPVSTQPIPQVELASVTVHGTNDALVAKVEVTVGGGPPPDGRSVRYLSLMRTVDGRWLVIGDTDSYHYMLNLISPALSNPYR